MCLQLQRVTCVTRYAQIWAAGVLVRNSVFPAGTTAAMARVWEAVIFTLGQ